MNRRGFLKGLAAALATSALVKLPAPDPVYFGIDLAKGADATAYWLGGNQHFYMMVSNSQWVDLTTELELASWDRSFVSEGSIGEYQGLQIRETCA